MPQPRRHRVPLKLPAALVQRASELADVRGDVLTDFIHAAVITAAKAAEAGRYELLPARLPRTGAPAEDGKQVRYTASTEQATRCADALEAAGSSMRVVIIRALEAYVAADGYWLDAVLPGEPGSSWRVSGAA